MIPPHSLAPQLKQYTAGLYKALRPLANAYARAVGHRQVGLKYDDLIMEERDDVQKVSLIFPRSGIYLIVPLHSIFASCHRRQHEIGGGE